MRGNTSRLWTGQVYLSEDTMFNYDVTIRVRYAETDQMGFVYYGNYAKYYEVARVESLRSLGLTYKSFEASGVLMPVLENWSKYIRPAHYDDLLKIKVYIRQLPGKRITFEYEIFNQENELIHVGRTTLAFVRTADGKSIEAPDTIRDLLIPFFDAG
jgi:acyl-CoA thioester hydrolase